jgi:short-subunit dehydrogenase
MKDTGIHVVLIEPGPVMTDFRKNAILQFERWVDWENSARVAQYRDSLLDKLHKTNKRNRFELPASAVTAKLIHALEAPRPKPRYYVTTPTYLMGFCRRALPTRALDWVLSKG